MGSKRERRRTKAVEFHGGQSCRYLQFFSLSDKNETFDLDGRVRVMGSLPEQFDRSAVPYNRDHFTLPVGLSQRSSVAVLLRKCQKSCLFPCIFYQYLILGQ